MARALGKGLSSLIAERPELEGVLDGSDKSALKVTELALRDITAGSGQPREHFDDEGLQELADSIKQQGVVQPILVRKQNESYEIIAGERRFRASKLAGKAFIPAIIRDVTDVQLFEIALIENIQRQDLSALEIAKGYQRLIDEHQYTQEQLAEVVGKSRSAVANQLRLLSLPDAVKALLEAGKISMGHAKVLLGVENAEELAHKVVQGGLSVRQLEQLLKQNKPSKPKPDAKPKGVTAEIAQRLSEKLGTKVQLTDHKGKGKLVISYDRPEAINGIITKLLEIKLDR